LLLITITFFGQALLSKREFKVIVHFRIIKISEFIFKTSNL